MLNSSVWIVKLLNKIQNHELTHILVCHSFVDRLTSNEQYILVDINKSLTLYQNNKDNVTIIKKGYYVRYVEDYKND